MIFEEFDPFQFYYVRKLLLAFSSIIILSFLYGLYQIIFRPIIRMKYYRKQGVPCTFFPLIGTYKESLIALKKHGDAAYNSKVKAQTMPQKIICSNLGSELLISVSDTAMVKEFYLNSENYVKDPIFLELFATMLGKGLLTSEGKQWKAQRKILSNAFHFGFLKSVLPSVQNTVRGTLRELKDTSLNQVNIMDVFQKITGEAVGKIFFGEQLNQHSIDGKPLTLVLADIMIQIAQLSLSAEKNLLGAQFVQKGILPKHKKLMDSVANFKVVCRNIITERKKTAKNDQASKDMLDLLLEYNGEEGKIEEEEIIDQFVTFFLAGMDTTGHLVTMAVYFLSKHPEFQAKMIEEFRTHYRTSEEVDIEDLNKLEFTSAFLKETLRMATPIPGVFPRKAVKDHKLGEFFIRKGDTVTVDFFYNSFNEQQFQEAQKFNPLRWLEKERSYDAYAYTPFSAGPRNCIGQHLAMNEAKIILAEFLMMYNFSLQKDYELKMTYAFLYEPQKPILLDLKLKLLDSTDNNF